MNKRLQIEHRVCDYACMWRGIEDIYQTKAKEEVPEFFFFTLSGQGEFSYLRQPKSENKYLVTWGDGRPKKIYSKVNDLIGFTYHHSEGTSFEQLLKKVKQEIDDGYPVVLGALDMYYLEYYPKIYHRFHIPIHYITAIGYDDEKQVLDILDCGVPEVKQLSFKLCEEALNVEPTGLGKKNGMCKIRFQENLPTLKEIAVKGFARKCENVLHPQVSFTGISGMRKLAKEIDTWQKHLTPEDYRKALASFCQFTGTVPNPPERLFGCKEDAILHHGCRDKYAKLLLELSESCGILEWKQAAGYFEESGERVQKITDSMVEFLLGQTKEIATFEEELLKIAQLEETANQLILKGCATV